MLLGQKKALQILRKYSINFPETVIFRGELPDKNFKYPAVLKVDSPQIVHKTDMGTVFLNLKDRHALKTAVSSADTLMKMHGIKEYDLVVQEMANGQELMMGMSRDGIFGPVILFGLGGIFVEIIKDFSMRIAPLSKKDCEEMIEEIKAKKILDGYRKMTPVDKKSIIDMLMKLSKLSMSEKHISEIDFNPVMANSKKAMVVDARLIKDA